ncbi:hypothetical protein DRN74_06740 [Candidatus Micrarchaeota archaeon]|nr:MAG: hypothetical protein DRN74_06740 [Candidatus Micrarchaeota archaeon]
MNNNPWGQQAAMRAASVEQPVERLSTLESDVYVPALQALLLAVVWGLAAVVVAAVVVIISGLAWWFAAAVFVVVVVVVLAWQATAGVQLRRELLWRQEVLEGVDLDGDGVVGSPALQVEVKEGNRVRFVDFGVDEERVAQLARGVLAGRPLSEAEWSGRGAPFSLREFRRLRGELIERGLAAWVNERAHSQGVVLTAAGRAVFRRIANSPSG